MTLGFNLPPELLDEIISLVSRNPLPGAYGRDFTATADLLVLCITNHTFWRIAIPYLYSSIILTIGRQVDQLLRTFETNPNLACHVRTLSFRPDSLELGIIGHDVLRLAQLCSILSPSLRRLLIDKRVFLAHDVLRQLDPFRDSFSQLTSITEFADVQDIELTKFNAHREPYIAWNRWTSLERLAFSNQTLDAYFVTAIIGLPNLTHLCVEYAIFEAAGMSSVHKLMSNGESKLRRIMFIDARLSFSLLGEDQAVRSVARMARDGLEVVELDPIKPFPRVTWMRDRMEDGTLWELDGAPFAQLSNEQYM